LPIALLPTSIGEDAHALPIGLAILEAAEVSAAIGIIKSAFAFHSAISELANVPIASREYKYAFALFAIAFKALGHTGIHEP
jgi:hypothetical protein